MPHTCCLIFYVSVPVSEASSVVYRDGPFHQKPAVVFRKFQIEPFRRAECALVCRHAPFFPEMRVHAAIHGFAFLLAPGVPHVVEETGDGIFRLIFHGSSICDSTLFVSLS